MAKRVKSGKKRKADKEALQREQEESVNIKELVKDERTHKIFGFGLLLVCVLLFVAFASYLFTWKEDQDKVFRGFEILLPSAEVKTDNLLGNLGAYISHQFFFNGFGIASFLFCSFFFVAGINVVTGKKVYSIGRNLRYIFFGIIIISVTAAFLLSSSPFPWGGAFGDMASSAMVRTLGRFGTGAILLVTLLAYIIWRFNPNFKLPERKPQPVVKTEHIQEELQGNEGNELTPVNETSSGNILKGNGSLRWTPADDEKVPEVELFIKEGAEMPFEENEEKVPPVKEEALPDEPAAVEAAPEENKVEIPLSISVIPPDPAPVQEGELELEIKTGPELTEEESLPSPQPVMEPYDPELDLKNYKYPSLDLLESHGTDKIVHDPEELQSNKDRIINTLRNYDIEISKISATVGPTVTLYEIVPAPGIRISRIKNLEDDIALSLAALGIRIIAPIPGKGTIGIEVPNVKKSIVSMRTLLSSDKFQNSNFSLPIAIGKRIDNENFIVDLATMPHLLMAGATGQGKSVGLNAILVSLLYKKHPSQLKFVLVDPKKVELSLYRTIEKHFLAKLPGEEEAIITDTKKVIYTLNALCIEMDRRYDLLKEAGARNLKEYNEKFIKRRLNPEKGHEFLPFIVLVIDEFADLIMTAGKEVEMPIARLAQLARAVGIHLIIATQRPSVNIITGTIKANFPSRIAFKVSSKIDSRTILDAGGAEQLIGKGDMLISHNGTITRLQCAFVDTPEVERICDFIGSQRGYPEAYKLPEYVDEKELEKSGDFDASVRDAKFDEAALLVVQTQQGSTSLLQRRMKLGYNRAGRLMDQLESAGIVGPAQGSKPRDVYIKSEVELHQLLSEMG